MVPFPMTLSDPNLDFKVTELLYIPSMYCVSSLRAICLR